MGQTLYFLALPSFNFIQLFFILVTVPFFIALWAKPAIHVLPSGTVCPFNSQLHCEWLKVNVAVAGRKRTLFRKSIIDKNAIKIWCYFLHF
jgi:hypothetical protein